MARPASPSAWRPPSRRTIWASCAPPLIALIENPNIQDRSLLKFVKGPDFPTGGIVVEDPAAIAEAYKTGRGCFRVRARWEKEEGARGVYQIVVTEIPYQVQKSKLIERIAELLEQKKLPLLDDIHDESAEDIRIVLTPKSRTVDAGNADGAAVPRQPTWKCAFRST